jgi:hypothetical protein
MLSSAVRLALFVPLAVWLSVQPGFVLERVWWLSVATVWIQAVVSCLLLRGEVRRRLSSTPEASAAVASPAQ